MIDIKNIKTTELSIRKIFKNINKNRIKLLLNNSYLIYTDQMLEVKCIFQYYITSYF